LIAPNLSFGGGDGSKLSITEGGKLQVGDLKVTKGAVNASQGPLLELQKVGANAGTLQATRLWVGQGDDTHPSGHILIGKGTSATINGRLEAVTEETIKIEAGPGVVGAQPSKRSPILLTVEGELTAETADLGIQTGLGRVGAGVLISKTGHIKITSSNPTPVRLGDGNLIAPRSPDVFSYIEGNGSITLVAGSKILKYHGGDLEKGISTAVTKIGGTGADITPGDGLARDIVGKVVLGTTLVVRNEYEDLISTPFYEYDEFGAIVLDERGLPVGSDHSSMPFGTLTMSGLDASDRMTLNSLIGPDSSTQSSLLYITGTATLNGDLSLPGIDGLPTFGQLHIFTTSSATEIPLNTPYTILTADEGFNPSFLSTGFADYPWFNTAKADDYYDGNLYTRAINGMALGQPGDTWWVLSMSANHHDLTIMRVEPQAPTLAVTLAVKTISSAYGTITDPTHVNAVMTYAFDPFFTTRLNIETLRPNSPFESSYASRDALGFDADLDELDYTGAVYTLTLAAADTTRIRLSAATLSGQVLLSEYEEKEVDPPNATGSGLHFNWNTSGGFAYGFWDSLDTAPADLMGAWRNLNDPHTQDWEVYEADVGGWPATFPGLPGEEYIFWSAADPGHVQTLTLSPSLSNFDGTLTGKLNSNGDVVLTGWNTTTYAAGTIRIGRATDAFSYHLGYGIDSTSGSTSSLTLTSPGLGYFGAHYGTGSGLASKLSNFVDFAAPAAPTDAAFVGYSDSSGDYHFGVTWQDNAYNESFYQVQRGDGTTWADVDTTEDAFLIDDLAWLSYAPDQLQYRVRAGRAFTNYDSTETTIYSSWTTTSAKTSAVYVHNPDAGTITLSHTASRLEILDGITTISIADTRKILVDSGTRNQAVTVDQTPALFASDRFGLKGTGTITLTVAHSTMTFETDIGIDAPHLTLEAASGAALTLNSNQTLEQLLINPGTSVELTTDQFSIETITSNGTLSFNATSSLLITAAITGGGTVAQLGSSDTTLTGGYAATGSLYVNAGTLQFAETLAERWSAGVMLKFQSLTIASWAILDITNHDLLIGNSSIGTVETLILAGYGLTPAGSPSSAGAPAIISSTAIDWGNAFLVPIDADALMGDGSPGSAITQTFDEVEITESSSIIIKFAYSGDADLSGTIDGDELEPDAANYRFPFQRQQQLRRAA
jgi:hypothetical protein